MDEDVTPPLPKCFICEGLETSAQRFIQATSKGHSTILQYAEAVQNAILLERLKEAQNVGRLKYHITCKNDLFHKFVAVNTKAAKASEAEKELAKMKRRRTCSDVSASTACSSTRSQTV